MSIPWLILAMPFMLISDAVIESLPLDVSNKKFYNTGCAFANLEAVIGNNVFKTFKSSALFTSNFIYSSSLSLSSVLSSSHS